MHIVMHGYRLSCLEQTHSRIVWVFSPAQFHVRSTAMHVAKNRWPLMNNGCASAILYTLLAKASNNKFIAYVLHLTELISSAIIIHWYTCKRGN